MKGAWKILIIMAAAIVVAALVLVIFSRADAGGEKIITKAFMYHAVSDDASENASLFVSPGEFERQIKALCDAGYRSVFADEFGEYSYKTAAITFDDGYENVYANAFPILKKYGVKATVFLITLPADGHLTDDEIAEMASSGLVSFGSHTDTHRDLTSLSEDELISELSESKEKIEKITKKKAAALSYPYGAHDDKVAAAAKKCGYECAYTVSLPGGDDDRFALPRYTVWRETGIYAFLEMIK